MGANDNENAPASIYDILILPDLDYCLTEWEKGFVESMSNWCGDPTDRQQDILDEIFKKYKIMADWADVMDAKTPTRLPAVSFTFHRNWENCPRQAWHVNIARDTAPAETEAMRWGTRVHEALEQHLGHGEALPPELSHHAHLYQFPAGYEIDAELKLGMREDGSYCDFFDSDAWMRGVIDVLLTKPEQPDWAVIIDHKTGKIREDPAELQMHALLLRAYNPKITNVKGWYNWLRDNQMGRVYDLSDTETMLEQLRKVRDRIEAAYILGERAFPPRQSGLCPYCAVRSCEFHP